MSQFFAGRVDAIEHSKLGLARSDLAIGEKSLLDGSIDRRADGAARGVDRCPRAVVLVERQPGISSDQRAIALGLDRVRLQVTQRRAYITRLCCRLRLADDWIAGAQVGRHFSARHARPLQQREGFARIDCAELLAVPHQDQAVNASQIGETDELFLVLV